MALRAVNQVMSFSDGQTMAINSGRKALFNFGVSGWSLIANLQSTR
jgi:hypothetical protein